MFTDLMKPEAIAEFTALGAVKAGCMLFDRPRRYGLPELAPDTSIIYFFDAHDREIGYWVVGLSDMCGPVIFAPNYRTWHASFLDKLQLEPLESPGLPVIPAAKGDV
jgi:hypothetical protein